MAGTEIVTEVWDLAEIERECQDAAVMLVDGHAMVHSSTDASEGVLAYARSLRDSGLKRRYGDRHSLRALSEVFGYWVTLSHAIETGKIRTEEEVSSAVSDPVIFSRGVEGTSEALFYFYRTPGWNEMALGLTGVSSLYERGDSTLRGALLAGDILSRWNKVDPGWAICGGGIRAWLLNEDRSIESARAMIERVDSTLALLSTH